jgi:hypothetical protein
MKLTTDNQSSTRDIIYMNSRSFAIPKEIMIKTYETGEDHVVDDNMTDNTRTSINTTTTATITPLRPVSITTPMEWDPQESAEEQDTHRQSSRCDKYNGCIVSLPSSDCSSMDPLDYRKDWSSELELDNNLTLCLAKNPDFFVVSDEEEDDELKMEQKISDVSDDNSLCSYLSEDYDMDSEDHMTGLWDDEQHDITMPAWVTQNRI